MTSAWRHHGGPGWMTSAGRHRVTWRSTTGPRGRWSGDHVGEWRTRWADVVVTCAIARRGRGRDRCHHIGTLPVRRRNCQTGSDGIWARHLSSRDVSVWQISEGICQTCRVLRYWCGPSIWRRAIQRLSGAQLARAVTPAFINFRTSGFPEINANRRSGTDAIWWLSDGQSARAITVRGRALNNDISLQTWRRDPPYANWFFEEFSIVLLTKIIRSANLRKTCNLRVLYKVWA